MPRSLVALAVLAALALPALAPAARNAPAGSLSIEGATGTVVLRAKGGVIGRVARGSVQIVDLTPKDKWSPTINGLSRGAKVWLRGENLSFRLLGGQYRLLVKGEGISLAARGKGQAQLDGDVDALGQVAGVFAVDVGRDCLADPGGCLPFPADSTRVSFGPADDAAVGTVGSRG
jgi:hypothetical protein